MVPVTGGHEVSESVSRQDHHAHYILSEIAAGKPISQRALSSNLGIALGMTNLLLRRLVRRGLVRVSRVRPNRLAYFLTPSGMAEKARMSKALFQNSVRVYASARDRISAAFETLSRDWPHDRASDGKRIMFVGTGEAAEIAYLCLHDTDLTLVGVIDFQGRKRFFGVPVYRASDVSAELRHRITAEDPTMVAFSDADQVHRFFADAGVQGDRVCWI